MVSRGARAAQRRRVVRRLCDYSVSFQFYYFGGQICSPSRYESRAHATPPSLASGGRAADREATTRCELRWPLRDRRCTARTRRLLTSMPRCQAMPDGTGGAGTRTARAPHGISHLGTGVASHHNTSPLRALLKPCQEGAWPCDQGTTDRAHPFLLHRPTRHIRLGGAASPGLLVINSSMQPTRAVQ